MAEGDTMRSPGIRPSSYGLEKQGIRNTDVVYWNLGAAQLVENAVAHGGVAGERPRLGGSHGRSHSGLYKSNNKGNTRPRGQG